MEIFPGLNANKRCGLLAFVILWWSRNGERESCMIGENVVRKSDVQIDEIWSEVIISCRDVALRYARRRFAATGYPPDIDEVFMYLMGYVATMVEELWEGISDIEPYFDGISLESLSDDAISVLEQSIRENNNEEHQY